MRVSTNLSAINARRNLTQSMQSNEKGLSQLASGQRINKAADDAAGLAISERLKGQIRSVQQANRNANDGISMIQTAEGSLNEIGSILVRLRELGMQSATDSLPATERSFIQMEVSQLKDEINRISDATTWGSTKLLDGHTPAFDFQVGIFNDGFEDRISFDASENTASTESFGISGIDASTKETSQDLIGLVDRAQIKNNEMRANLGALQNRLVSTVNNLEVANENLSASNSRIRDTNVAAASSEITRSKIQLQASVATLSQANVQPQMALNLIGS